MSNPLTALRAYFAPPGSGTPSEPYAPWQRTLQSGFEGSMDALKGLIGVGDDTSANHIGQLLGAATPLFRLPGGKILKPTRGMTNMGKTGQSFAIQEGEQAAQALKRLQSLPSAETVRAPEELADITKLTPPTVVPPPASRRGTGEAMKPTRNPNVKANPTIVKTIRDLDAAGKPIEVIQQEFPELAKGTISAIIKRDLWNWVK